MKFNFCINESHFMTKNNSIVSSLSMTEAVRGCVEEKFVNIPKLLPYIIEFIFYKSRKNN